MAYCYRVHGLTLASELELPELSQRTAAGEEPDVRASLAALPPFAEAKSTPIPFLRLVDDAALFDLENAGRYLVRGGREVVIDIYADPDLALVRLFLLGSVMGMICQQRGLLALHASAVAFNDRVVAFTGTQGAGKSTIAAYCLTAVGRLMADDVLVVGPRQNGRVMAYPGMPRVKLWRDAIRSLGRESDGLVRDWFRADKFHVPVDHARRPLPLSRLYVLDEDDSAGAGRFTRLTGALAAGALLGNTYCVEYIDAMGGSERHFRQCAELANAIEIIQLARSRSPSHLPSTAALISNAMLAPIAGELGYGRATG